VPVIEDPPVPYAQIGATLGIPVGSIGPARAAAAWINCAATLKSLP
jgi:hypothetical protein